MAFFKNPETGNVGEIPAERVEEALSDGLIQVTKMHNPETGNSGWVENTKAREALDDGLEIIPTSDSNVDISMGEAGLRGFAKGATLGFSPYVAGAQAAAKKLLSGNVSDIPEAYTSEKEMYEKMDRMASDQNPVTYGGAEILGNIGVTAPLAGATAGKISSGIGNQIIKHGFDPNTAGKIAIKALPLAGAGAVSGAASNLESGDVVKGALTGATVGALLPTVGEKIISPVSKGLGEAAGSVAKTIEKFGGGDGVASGLTKTLALDLLGGGGGATGSYMGAKISSPILKMLANKSKKLGDSLNTLRSSEQLGKLGKALNLPYPPVYVKGYVDSSKEAGAVSGGFTGLMDYLNNPEKPKEDYSNNESNTYDK